MTTRPPNNAPPKRYVIGNAVTVRARLTDASGEVVDPANLRLLFSGPGDVESTTVAMTVDEDDAIGVFTPDRDGLWWYRVETFQGDVSAAEERAVIVLASSLPPP